MAKNARAQKKRRREVLREAHKREKRLRWLRYGGLAVIILGFLGAFTFFRASTAPEVDAPDEVMAANIIGPADAKVTIVEFGDFGCPSCRAWHNSGIKEALLERYTDQINFTFRHFPVITRQSPQAAEAGQCASEQGRFWDYHDYIYEQAPSGGLSEGQLKNYADVIGLDASQFDQCLDSGRYRSYVGRDQSAAIAAGARGTPSFYINGQPAAFSFEAMSAIIEHELES